jgi:hypothetical protein
MRRGRCGFVAGFDDEVGDDFVEDFDGFREGVTVVAEGDQVGFYCKGVLVWILLRIQI